jgi:hypothetical protein
MRRQKNSSRIIRRGGFGNHCGAPEKSTNRTAFIAVPRPKHNEYGKFGFVPAAADPDVEAAMNPMTRGRLGWPNWSSEPLAYIWRPILTPPGPAPT